MQPDSTLPESITAAKARLDAARDEVSRLREEDYTGQPPTKAERAAFVEYYLAGQDYWNQRRQQCEREGLPFPDDHAAMLSDFETLATVARTPIDVQS